MFTAALTLATGLFLLFEDNDDPFEATQLGGINHGTQVTQTHDFDAVDDEDWLVVDPIPGIWTISVLESSPPTMGSLVFGVALFDEDRLNDVQAAPVVVLSDCAAPTAVNAVSINFQTRGLFFFRIEECQGLASGEYDVTLNPVKLDSPFDPVLIQGTVRISGTATVVPGVFVVTNVNSATLSQGNGAYALSVNAFTPVVLSVNSPDYQSSVEFVGSQNPGANVTNVDIEVTQNLGEDIFGSSFESGG